MNKETIDKGVLITEQINKCLEIKKALKQNPAIEFHENNLVCMRFYNQKVTVNINEVYSEIKTKLQKSNKSKLRALRMQLKRL